MPNGKNHSRDGAQSLHRALSVLRVVAAGGETGLPLSDVIQATGLTRPTAHRLINVLVGEGIVEKRPKSKRYTIGHQVPELALARRTRSPLIVAAEPFLLELAREAGDTAFLTIRTGLDALCVSRIMGSFPIQVLSIEVGARRPLGVSSAGVAILAALPLSAARQIVRKNEMRFSSYRTTAAIVIEQISEAQSAGYSIKHSGLVPGTKAMSATVREPAGQPIAAVTIAAIRSRLGPRREADIAEVLLQTARSIERAIYQEH